MFCFFFLAAKFLFTNVWPHDILCLLPLPPHQFSNDFSLGVSFLLFTTTPCPLLCRKGSLKLMNDRSLMPCAKLEKKVKHSFRKSCHKIVSDRELVTTEMHGCQGPDCGFRFYSSPSYQLVQACRLMCACPRVCVCHVHACVHAYVHKHKSLKSLGHTTCFHIFVVTKGFSFFFFKILIS